MKIAYVFLGPPLSGKSTKSIELGIPRFSVRHWFEPYRSSGVLPPIGTFLPDEIVIQAVKLFIQQNYNAPQIVFDGFPGNNTQFAWLKNELKGIYNIQIVYCSVFKDEALLRMKKRVVCIKCDGGADPVKSSIGGVCPSCGNLVHRRDDDSVEAFEYRWKSYFLREREMAVENTDFANEILRIEEHGMRMDLHIHSTFSDGIYTPHELILLSKECGLDLISLTDHDSLDGVKIAKTEANKHDILFIPGIEISALFEGQLIHFLGYNISCGNKALQKIIKYNQKARTAFDEKVLEILVDLKKISYECKLNYGEYKYDRIKGGWKLLNYLIDRQVCKNGFEYFELLKTLKVGEVSYVDATIAINAIKETGICIVAHPGTYAWEEAIMREKMNTLFELGVDGFECYHPLNKKSDRLLIKEFCNQYDMICTGGSDYHGNLPDRTLGEPRCYSSILKKLN